LRKRKKQNFRYFISLIHDTISEKNLKSRKKSVFSTFKFNLFLNKETIVAARQASGLRLFSGGEEFSEGFLSERINVRGKRYKEG
jgi:hypothetical protein